MKIVMMVILWMEMDVMLVVKLKLVGIVQPKLSVNLFVEIVKK